VLNHSFAASNPKMESHHMLTIVLNIECRTAEVMPAKLDLIPDSLKCGLVCAMFALYTFSNLRWNAVQRPEIQRLAKLLDPESGTGLTRSLQWQMAYEAVVSKRPLTLSYKKPDGLHSVRAIIGYGPDTGKIVSRQYIMPELIKAYGGYFVPDRFHNDFWDTLLTTGILGLIARFALFGCILIFSLKTMGIEIDLRSRLAFWASYLGGGILLAIVLGFRIGLGFVGLGFCIGTILGFILLTTLLIAFIQPNPDINSPESKKSHIGQVVLIAFLCLLGFAGIYQWNLRYSLAAIAAARAKQSESALACTLYRDAIKKSPSDDTYRYLLGKTLVERAIHSANIQERFPFIRFTVQWSTP
jgi:hypothetical protein